MATNFEFYKDEILRIARNGYVPILTKHGKVRGCGNTDCKYCAFSSQEKQCREVQFEWLYAEHTEPPKLTKRERAFCEAVQTGWIYKNSNNCFWTDKKPRNDGVTTWCCSGSVCGLISIYGLHFDAVKDVEKVEDLLKLDVIEEVQEDGN